MADDLLTLEVSSDGDTPEIHGNPAGLGASSPFGISWARTEEG
jgi:hypothetical protein